MLGSFLGSAFGGLVCFIAAAFHTGYPLRALALAASLIVLGYIAQVVYRLADERHVSETQFGSLLAALAAGAYSAGGEDGLVTFIGVMAVLGIQVYFLRAGATALLRTYRRDSTPSIDHVNDLHQ